MAGQSVVLAPEGPQGRGGADRELPFSPRAHIIAARPVRRRRWLLAGILLFSALLRLWNYDFDVGYRFVPDADDKIEQALVVAEGDLTPRNWVQPYFLPYSGGAVMAALGILGADLQGERGHDVAKRALTIYMILFSVAAVAVTYFVACAAFGDPRVGLLAAAALAVAPINVIGSRYIKEDIPLLFWVNLALAFLVRMAGSPRLRNYLGGALAIGAALATKWTAVLLLPVLVGADLMGRRADRRSCREVRARARLLMAVPIVAGAFLLFNPYVLLRARSFFAGVLYQTSYGVAGHHDGTRVEPWPHLWTFYLRHAIAPGLTVPLTIAFLTGLLAVVWRSRRGAADGATLLAGWVVLGYLAFEMSPAKPLPFFARYIHFLVPAMAALAGFALVRLLEAARLHSRAAVAGATAAVALTLGCPLAKSIAVTASIDDDTRLRAARWIASTTPAGTRLVADGEHYSPPLDRSPFRARGFDVIAPARLHNVPVAQMKRLGVDHAVLNSFKIDRFSLSVPAPGDAAAAAAYYTALRAELPLVASIRPRFALQSYGFHNPVIFVHRVPR